VLTDEGHPAVLKVGTRHPETEHEHLALQHWHGDGAVRLLRADPRRMALLLERLSTDDLTDVWDVEACEIVAGFYPRLHKPAPPQLMRLSSYVAEHVERLDRLPVTPPCRGGWSSTPSRSAGCSPPTRRPTVG
jgi:streptomycin 6-kinase